MKRILLNYKNTLIAFRFVGFLLLLFLLIYKPDIEDRFADIPFLPLIIYFISNVLLFFVKREYLQKNLCQFGLFLFDILIISWLIYISQGWSSDLYLIYFLVIFMSGIQMRIWQSFLIGTLACIIYSFFVFKSSPDIKLTTHILLRFPFFYLVSFYTAFLAHYAKEMREKMEMDYQEQLSYAEKRAMLGQLAGRIAAEMTNPLSVAMGFAQGIIKRIPDSHEFYMPLSSILRESVRCVQMIENLLLLSDEIDSRTEMIDINALTQNILTELSLPSKDISTELILDSALPLLKGDRKQIFRAIKNIVENSVEAMPSGGKITFTTRKGRLDPPHNIVPPEESDSPSATGKPGQDAAIEIVISDTGDGISDEHKDRIFEPFFSTRKERIAGLGLSVASAIIQRHKGQISFESRTGQWTRFKLKFAPQLPVESR